MGGTGLHKTDSQVLEHVYLDTYLQEYYNVYTQCNSTPPLITYNYTSYKHQPRCLTQNVLFFVDNYSN